MNFSERADARKKSKERKNQLKEIRKTMLAAGLDKVQSTADLKALQEAIELGCSLRDDYEAAGAHLLQAREAIIKLLDCMGESPASEVKESLKVLVSDLEQVYHDCSIREDDIDFQSTIQSLRQMVNNYTEVAAGMSQIMLRSEIENVGAVLDDAAGWKAPDFLALAYYMLHEERSLLKEMENGQRNMYVVSYFKERFMDDFMKRCTRAGVEKRIRRLTAECGSSKV